MLALLLSLIAAAQHDPVTVALNHDQFARGDRARVYVQTAQDGYLIVLHADPDGRVRVLFPLDPGADDFVRGTKRRELAGRSGRDAFLVDADQGSGMVLAAWSADAFDHTAFVRGDHWDYRALSAGTVKDDPLVILLDVVRTMAGARRFEYDAVSYVVTGVVAARSGFGYGSGWGYPHYRFGVFYGYWYSPFYDPFCYDPFWSRCYGFGYSYYRPYRSSFYRPFWFNPGGGSWGRTFGKYVIPDRNRDRFVPVEPRPRSSAPSGFGLRDRQPPRRMVEPGAPRAREGGRPTLAPRDRGAPPRITPSQPRGSRSRPSVSRGSNGGSRPAARPAPSGGGRRGGGGRRP
jgi:hypothetical protein